MDCKVAHQNKFKAGFGLLLCLPTQQPKTCDAPGEENLWTELKTKVHARGPSDLERFAKEEWAGVAQELCVRLVENYKTAACPAKMIHNWLLASGV